MPKATAHKSEAGSLDTIPPWDSRIQLKKLVTGV
jgi:hypothetical protein